jgi:hypothetical protein
MERYCPRHIPKWLQYIHMGYGSIYITGYT